MASWAERAKNREKDVKKQQKLLSKKNKNLYNFGVMLDFFGYSAFSVQCSMKDIDFAV